MNVTLPDQIVLDFSFTAVSGQAGLLCQLDYAGDHAYNPPDVGETAADVSYEGVGSSPASWSNIPNGTGFYYPIGTVYAAAVPDPATILVLGIGVVGLARARRRQS